MIPQMVYPVGMSTVIESQSFAEHEAWARMNGLCTRPGKNCKGWYYGGIDWASRVGPIRVYAALAGIVTHVGYNDKNTPTTGYGYFIRTKHPDGIEITYAHLAEDSALVQVGQRVTVSQTLGTMGSTGNSTGLHLHFQVTQNGIPIDPAPVLSGWGVTQPPPVEPPDVPPPPVFEPNLPPGIETAPPGVKFIVTAQGLRIRNGPGTNYIEIGQHQVGAELTALRVYIPEFWVEFAPGQWSAVKFGGDSLMSEKE